MVLSHLIPIFQLEKSLCMNTPTQMDIVYGFNARFKISDVQKYSFIVFFEKIRC